MTSQADHLSMTCINSSLHLMESPHLDGDQQRLPAVPCTEQTCNGNGNCSDTKFPQPRMRRYRNAWGNLSYANLIAAAILSSPKKKMKLNEIYSWFIKTIPYFSEREDDVKSRGWKNSIRHNLSLKREFVRESGEKKAGYWYIDEDSFMDRLKAENRQISDPLYNREMEMFEQYILQRFKKDIQSQVTLSMDTCFHEDETGALKFVDHSSCAPTQGRPPSQQENPFYVLYEDIRQAAARAATTVARDDDKKPFLGSSPSIKLSHEAVKRLDAERLSDAGSDPCVSTESFGPKFAAFNEAVGKTNVNAQNGLEMNSTLGNYGFANKDVNPIAPTSMVSLGGVGGQMYMAGGSPIVSGTQQEALFLLNYQQNDGSGGMPGFTVGGGATSFGGQVIQMGQLPSHMPFISIVNQHSPLDLRSIDPNALMVNYNFDSTYHPLYAPLIPVNGNNYSQGDVSSGVFYGGQSMF